MNCKFEVPGLLEWNFPDLHLPGFKAKQPTSIGSSNPVCEFDEASMGTSLDVSRTPPQSVRNYLWVVSQRVKRSTQFAEVARNKKPGAIVYFDESLSRVYVDNANGFLEGKNTMALNRAGR
jgi:hypothetical protein